MTFAPLKNPRRSRRSRDGFTLIEILVVLVIIATLASIVAPNVLQHVGTAKEDAAKAQVEMLAAALDAYRLDNGVYPSSSQGLEALRVEPQTDPRPKNWRGPYLRKTLPSDPWGHAYAYSSPGTANPWGYDLLSYGADGVTGGTQGNADIVSW